jgi:AbrB family looped-hinge helix DNA binding protein
MITATITSKGQVTIPVAVRKDMGLKPGSKLDFICDQDGTWRVVKKKRSILDLAASFEYDGEPISVEEMSKSAKQHVVDSFFKGERG